MKKFKLGKRSYFHISKSYLGDQHVFTPKVPETAIIKIEGNIPRICVSPSILKCMRALAGGVYATIGDFIYPYRDKEVYNNPSLYVTEAIPFSPPDATDFRVNSEHWFLEDTKMQFIGYICLNELTRLRLKLTSEKVTLTEEQYINQDLNKDFKLFGLSQLAFSLNEVTNFLIKK